MQSGLHSHPLKWRPVIVLLTLASVACGTAPVKRFYTLENTALPAEAPTQPLCKRPLVIPTVEVAPPYDLKKIVFRSDSLEVRYYNHRNWVSAPEEMLTKLIVRRFEMTRLFPVVESSMYSSRNHLSLLVKLNNLEEIDRGGTWYARLAMSFILRDETAEASLWNSQFDIRKEVPQTEVKAVVEVLNSIYNEEIDKVVASLTRLFNNQNGCGE